MRAVEAGNCDGIGIVLRGVRPWVRPTSTTAETLLTDAIDEWAQERIDATHSATAKSRCRGRERESLAWFVASRCTANLRF